MTAPRRQGVFTVETFHPRLDRLRLWNFRTPCLIVLRYHILVELYHYPLPLANGGSGEKFVIQGVQRRVVAAAEDFAFALRRVLDPTVASELAAAFYGIDGAAAYNTALTVEDGEPVSLDDAALDSLRDAVAVTALDSYRLQITLAQANPAFLQVLTLPAAFPVRADVIAEHGRVMPSRILQMQAALNKANGEGS